jgi:hypothetical protein
VVLAVRDRRLIAYVNPVSVPLMVVLIVAQRMSILLRPGFSGGSGVTVASVVMIVMDHDNRSRATPVMACGRDGSYRRQAARWLGELSLAPRRFICVSVGNRPHSKLCSGKVCSCSGSHPTRGVLDRAARAVSSASPESAVLPEPRLLFQHFQTKALTEGGARQMFQGLVTDLVSLEHPTADTVAGPGGYDWGIDTYAGRFDETLSVWQSKFFLDGVGPSQQQQIRESFAQVCKDAATHGLAVDAWFLALPCDLAPQERQWFDGWSSRASKKTGIPTKLLGGSELRRQLMRPDAEFILNSYFGTITGSPREAEPVVTTDDLATFDNALFVRQLDEAGMRETDAARGFFFAADALLRDLAARGDDAAKTAMNELHLEIQYVWEQHFNSRQQDADHSGRIVGLIEEVLSGAAMVADPEPLRLRPAHRRGVAHRLVENARAGWVVHWRDVAEEHRALVVGAGQEVGA